MTKGKVTLFILILVISIISCKNDDDGGVTSLVLLNRAEQQIVDNDTIIKYMEKHYYNSSAFDDSNPDVRISDLIITELEEGQSVPSGNTLLMNAVETFNTNFADTNYEYYVLKLKQGSGHNKPTFADDIRANYQGFTLDGTVFEDNTNTPTSFSLLSVIRGWLEVFPKFNTSSSFTIQNDGVVNYSRPGMGVMIIPSGLAYLFPVEGRRLPVRLPLVFKFELLQNFENDTDGDGIPSYLEDINGDQVFTVLNSEDNTDGDRQPNVGDNDDDNDGILTKDEIVITTENRATAEEVRIITLESNQVLLNQVVKEDNGTFTGKIITFTDSDGDGIPDYLDAN